MQITIQPSCTFKGRHDVKIMNFKKTILELKDQLIGNLEDLESDLASLTLELVKYRKEHQK